MISSQPARSSKPPDFRHAAGGWDGKANRARSGSPWSARVGSRGRAVMQPPVRWNRAARLQAAPLAYAVYGGWRTPPARIEGRSRRCLARRQKKPPGGLIDGSRQRAEHEPCESTDASLVRAGPVCHTGQGPGKRAMGLPKEALRAAVGSGPRAALTRCGEVGYPAPGGDAVAGRGTRQAATHDHRRQTVGAEMGKGDRFGGAVR
jgi:hypothetical protein